MNILSVTAKGQITLKRELLQHIGIQHGQKLEVVKLSDGELRIKAKQQTQPISNNVSVEKMNQALAVAWARS